MAKTLFALPYHLFEKSSRARAGRSTKSEINPDVLSSIEYHNRQLARYDPAWFI
jgi:hypothetical protein